MSRLNCEGPWRTNRKRAAFIVRKIIPFIQQGDCFSCVQLTRFRFCSYGDSYGSAQHFALLFSLYGAEFLRSVNATRLRMERENWRASRTLSVSSIVWREDASLQINVKIRWCWEFPGLVAIHRREFSVIMLLTEQHNQISHNHTELWLIIISRNEIKMIIYISNSIHFY